MSNLSQRRSSLKPVAGFELAVSTNRRLKYSETGEITNGMQIVNQYHSDGIRFSYPSDWELREEQAENQTSIDLIGPATASCSVILLRDCPDAESAVEAAVDAFRDEYDDIDRQEIHEVIANRQTVGCDLDFIYFELCSAVSVRAFCAEYFTALLICQASSDDVDHAEAAFHLVCESIDCDGNSLSEA